ncbi:MAG: OmpA family protein [Bacteroidia bacterium]|nr:OmpA family protein [Bacteroidia bacterium]
MVDSCWLLVVRNNKNQPATNQQPTNNQQPTTSNFINMIRLKLTIIAFICLTSTFAQNVEFTKDNFKNDKDGLKEAKRNIEAGDDFYKQGEVWYKSAIEPYLKANAFNPNNAMLNFKIGKSYFNTSFKTRALPYLEKALKLDPNVDPQIHYLFGRAYHLNLEWDKAIGEYNKFLSILKGDELELLGDDVKKKIQECNNGKELVKHPVRVFIDNVGPEVNTKYPEYGAVISADESVMIFTSRRDNTTGGEIDPGLNEYFEDIYLSSKKDGKWSVAVNIGPPINTKGHDATAGLSPDGQTLYVYIDNGGDGNIYECNLKGSVWTKPDKMNKYIDTDAHESTASLSFDERSLYFVSNRKGGLGDRDIYISRKDEKNRWAKPLNIGVPINTQYGEEGVFIHPDGKTMYFSSQGHNSMGGYDIFKSTLVNGIWTEPENLGYPINTADDDVFFAISASGKHGYYSSFNASGYGEKDIYMITFLGDEKPMVMNNEDNLLASAAEPVKERVIAAAVEIKSAQITILKGVITDEKTGQPVEAAIELVDNEKNEVIANFNSNSTSGKYLVSLPSGKNYGIAVKAEGYLFHSENITIPASAAYQEIVKDIALKKIEIGTKIVLNNIFFDFDKATLRPESTNELERLIKLLNDMPTLKIEISGHTDGKGSAGYNQVLSESRAKSVVDYLISHGIKSDRLTFKGYGLTQPIATNDTEEGRQLNRRTEFKIMSK